jgi:hypothetical protein
MDSLQHDRQEARTIFGQEADNRGMIVEVRGSKVILNKKQLAICFAPRKYEIKEAIAELRRSKQLPGYKPNYGRIINIYITNTARLLKLEDEKKGKNKVDSTPADDADAIVNINSANMTTALPIDIASNLYIDMLKEIILCDYNHVDYNPKTDDELLSSVAIVKGRKKVVLTRKSLSWENGPFEHIGSYPPGRFYWLDQNRNYSDDPDDDYEERKERRILKQRMIERQRMYMTDPVLIKQGEELGEISRQIDELSNLSLKKEISKLQGRIAEIKLGMEIARIVDSTLSPESGMTYKELAYLLFPQIRTKNDKELEPYIQRIVRAIDAVQIYILTRCFRKRRIRIFPIALPLKQDNGIIERVFNGYKKKYIDKVLLEFITR